MPFWTSLAFYGVDEYRETFDMAMESCFDAFDADEVPGGLIGFVSRAKVQKRFEAYGTGIRLKGATGNV